jgi:hypothetical protein
MLPFRCKLVTDSHRRGGRFTDQFNAEFMVGKTAIGQIYLRVDIYSPATFAPSVFIHGRC